MAKKKPARPKIAATPTKPKGRPRGSKNVERDECDVIASRCKRCGSSRRKPYQSDPTTLAAAGTDPITGASYTHVIWRRTACKDCGQARIDKCYEYRETEDGPPPPLAA